MKSVFKWSCLVTVILWTTYAISTGGEDTSQSFQSGSFLVALPAMVATLFTALVFAAMAVKKVIE